MAQHGLAQEHPGVLGFRDMIEKDRSGQPQAQLMARVLHRIERLRKTWDANTAARAIAKDSAEYLEEDQALPKWLRPNPQEMPEHWARKEKRTVDISNKLLGDLATTYSTPPIRTVTIPRVEVRDGELVPAETVAAAEQARVEQIAVGNSWWDDHVWSFGEYTLDMVGSEVDRWTMYHGLTAVEPRYVADCEGTGRDGVEALFYRRHEMEVLTFEDDPRRAESVVFPIRKVTTVDTVGGPVTQQIFLYYDHEVFCRLTQWVIDAEQGFKIVNGEKMPDERFVDGLFHHGLGYMPIVFARERMVTSTFYPGGMHVNLKRTSQAINKLETEIGYTAKQQHGYLASKGKLKSAAIAVDAIIELETDGDLKMVQPGANLAGMIAVAQRDIDNTAMLAGLAPGSIVMDPTAAKSGIAISLEQSETARLRKERIPRIWQKFERRYARAAGDVYEVWGDKPGEVPEGTVQTAFQAPPKGLVSASETRESLAFEKSQGLTTPRDMLRELHPDWTDEQLDDRLDAVEAATRDRSHVDLAARKSDRETLLIEEQLGLITDRDLLIGLHPEWGEGEVQARLDALEEERKNRPPDPVAAAAAGGRPASPFKQRAPLGAGNKT